MDAVLFAVSLGLFSGISPGPLMTLVMTSSLERGGFGLVLLQQGVSGLGLI